MGCQADEGIAHEHSPGAVRDASRMAITGDLQILAREIVRVEPGIDDEQPSIVQTLHDLLVGEAGTPHIGIVWLAEDQGGKAIALPRQLPGPDQDGDIEIHIGRPRATATVVVVYM